MRADANCDSQVATADSPSESVRRTSDEPSDGMSNSTSTTSPRLTMMAGLPPDQRLAAQLFFVEGLTLAEIAEVQQVPEGTAKSYHELASEGLDALANAPAVASAEARVDGARADLSEAGAARWPSLAATAYLLKERIATMIALSLAVAAVGLVLTHRLRASQDLAATFDEGGNR